MESVTGLIAACFFSPANLFWNCQDILWSRKIKRVGCFGFVLSFVAWAKVRFPLVFGVKLMHATMKQAFMTWELLMKSRKKHFQLEFFVVFQWGKCDKGFHNSSLFMSPLPHAQKSTKTCCWKWNSWHSEAPHPWKYDDITAGKSTGAKLSYGVPQKYFKTH